VVADALPILTPPPLDPFAVEQIARVLRDEGKDTLILLAGQGVLAPAQALAWRVAVATGATIMGDSVNGRLARGRGRLPIERVPYNIDLALAALRRFNHIVLVNAKAPVGFFAYPGKPSRHYPSHTQLHRLSRPDQHAEAALEALVDAIGAPAVAIPDPGPRPRVARGAITPEGLAQTLAALLPEQAIVSDESVSYGRGLYQYTHAAPPTIGCT
jgi:acetolactate synthase-1/2/3 large subunit